MSAKPVNVVVYQSHDTGRNISPYGVQSVNTPNLERVAAEGVLFEQMYCTAPQCSPSRAGMYSGRYPHEVGVHGLTGHWAGWTMTDTGQHAGRRFKNAGYDTVLIGGAHEILGAACPPEMLDGAGFDDVIMGRADAATRARQLGEWLASGKGSGGFFAEIQTYETHTPYDMKNCTPEELRSVTVPPFLNDTPGTREFMLGAERIARQWDAGLGELIRILEERGIYDQTLLIVTTDHGLPAPRAKCTLYDPGIETLFMMRCPGLFGGGQRCPALLSQIDVFPTVFDLIGIPGDAGMTGRSFANLVRARGEYKEREYIFAEKTHHTAYDPKRCVRTRKYKYIRNLFQGRPEDCCLDAYKHQVFVDNLDLLGRQNPIDELYDLESDPLERNNLAEDASLAAVKAGLAKMLYDEMQRTKDPLLAGWVEPPAYFENLKAFKQLAGYG